MSSNIYYTAHLAIYWNAGRSTAHLHKGHSTILSDIYGVGRVLVFCKEKECSSTGTRCFGSLSSSCHCLLCDTDCERIVWLEYVVENASPLEEAGLCGYT